MIYVLGGGSGTQLNYKVVGGTSAPSNPVGNTIWINTSNAITFYTFQPLTPSNPQEGWVWINVAPSYSPVAFNALKENRIQLYPISAKQYISGAWVSKTAKTYQTIANLLPLLKVIYFAPTRVILSYQFLLDQSFSSLQAKVFFQYLPHT